MTYSQLKNFAADNLGYTSKIRYHQQAKGYLLTLKVDDITYESYIHPEGTADSNWSDFNINIKPILDTGLTAEGWIKAPNAVAGQQPIEYAMGHCAFEIQTDSEIGYTPSESSGHVHYERYQIKETLNLSSVNAAWLSVPRFTTINMDTGFYIDESQESTFQRLGGFTLNEGITLAGDNPVGISYPPESTWASAEIYPFVNIPGLGEKQLYIRIRVERKRTCFLDSSSNQIKPYIDIDFNFTRKK